MAQIGDDILCAFGAIALHFSELEESLVQHTAKLVNPRDFDVGLATLAGMDVRRVIEIFDALVRERTSWRYTMVRNPHYTKARKIHNRLKPLVLKIDQVRDRRNQIFHAYWSPSYKFDQASMSWVPSAGVAEHTKRKINCNAGYISKTGKWTVAQLEALAADIEEAARELDDFVTWANTLTPLFPEEEE
jgi:hypothetical protein